MFDAKTIRLAESLRPDLDFSVMGTEEFAILKIVENATGGGVVPVYDADIINGIASFSGVTKSKPLVSLKLNIPVTQTGSGTPYPAGGGKNKLPNNMVSGTNNGITYTVNDDGTVTVSGKATKESQKTGSFTLKAGSYIYSSGLTESFKTYDSYLSVSGKTIARGTYGDGSFTLADDSHVILAIRVRAEYGQTLDNLVFKPMIRLASETDDSFAPYENIRDFIGFSSVTITRNNGVDTGDTYLISFGQTVYSAILDVLNGKLFATHGIVDLGSLTWRYGSGSRVFYTEDITDMSEAIPFDNMACSAFETQISNTSFANMTNYSIKRGQSNTTIYIKDTDYTDADDFKTAVTGMKLVYELATPIEIQLTPTQITTLIGENVIFADVGDITECKYTRK